MSVRRSVFMLGVAATLALLAGASAPAHAQGLPPPPVPGSGLGDLLTSPSEWMTTMFNAALVGIGRRTTNDVVGFMSWLLGTGNIVSQTPPGLSYGSDVVGRLWGTVPTIANAGLAVVTVWSGFNLMKRATHTTYSCKRTISTAGLCWPLERAATAQ